MTEPIKSRPYRPGAKACEGCVFGAPRHTCEEHGPGMGYPSCGLGFIMLTHDRMVNDAASAKRNSNYEFQNRPE